MSNEDKVLALRAEVERLRGLVREYVACSPGIWDSRIGRRDSGLDKRARKATEGT
jgi:hypothetical protein